SRFLSLPVKNRPQNRTYLIEKSSCMWRPQTALVGPVRGHEVEGGQGRAGSNEQYAKSDHSKPYVFTKTPISDAAIRLPIGGSLGAYGSARGASVTEVSDPRGCCPADTVSRAPHAIRQA